MTLKKILSQEINVQYHDENVNQTFSSYLLPLANTRDIFLSISMSSPEISIQLRSLMKYCKGFSGRENPVEILDDDKEMKLYSLAKVESDLVI